MSLDLIPKHLRAKYTFAEWHHACAVLAIDSPDEFRDLMKCLDSFTQLRILAGGLETAGVGLETKRGLETKPSGAVAE
jgi:hypothetical protein